MMIIQNSKVYIEAKKSTKHKVNKRIVLRKNYERRGLAPKGIAPKAKPTLS